MPALGPLDRRTLRKRCVACTRRKIKCEGQPPCVYCTKKQQKCIPQVDVQKTEAVFVNTCVLPLARADGPLPVRNRMVSITHAPVLKLSPTVPLDKSDTFIGNFFFGFLAANDLGGSLDLDTIISQFQSSPCLFNATVAVGALHLSNKLSYASPIERNDARVGALKAYRTSLVTFRNDINDIDIKKSEASLWTTLFLSLFELMYDDTGEGFVKHFLFGTSKILQLRGPESHLTGAGRSFFLTVRVLEICRALIYSNFSEPTFLCQPSWRQLTERIREESNFWHPIQDLFALMIDISSLSNSVWEALRSHSDHIVTTFSTPLEELAAKGLLLRDGLDRWYVSFQQWRNHNPDHSGDGQSILAILYFHAISIFLSGIFDYRRELDHTIAPRLPQSRIQNHVDTILSDTRIALKNTNLGGVMFFFPLRVAGARVTLKEEAEAIVTMLNDISKRNFVVAEAFVSDLKALWDEKGV